MIHLSPALFAQASDAIANSPLSDKLFLAMLGGFAALVFGLSSLLYWLVRREQFRSRIWKSIHMVTLLVRVPKEASEREGEDGTRFSEKDIIGAAEQMFANFREINRRKEHVAFEIVATKGEIYFYVSVPRHLQTLVEKQILAQYPKASIEEHGSHDIFPISTEVVSARIVLKKPSVLPIRTYKMLDADPLTAIVNVMSKLEKNEGAALQLLIRPAKHRWRRKSVRIARDMEQGKSLHQAMHHPIVKFFRSFGESFADTLHLAGKKESRPQKSAREREDEKLRKLTSFEEDLIKQIEEKSAKPAFESNISVVVAAHTQEKARRHLENIASSFGQFYSAELNGFRMIKPHSQAQRRKWIRNFIFKVFNPIRVSILNIEELVSVFHFPTKYTEIPNLKRLEAKAAPAPAQLPDTGVILGQNEYRGVKKVIRMLPDDRRRHMYVIGKTGSGKTTLMKSLAAQDIQSGQGVCVIDPHGDFIEDMLKIIPKERAEDVILFDPGDTERPMGLNMLEYQTPEQKDFVVDEMIAIFHKLFPPEIVGPMFEHNMRNVMLTLMSDPDKPGTIAEIPRMFTDKAFQEMKINSVTDPIVRDFWEKEMAQTSDFHKSEMLGYLISKVGQFVENSMMRNIIGQQVSAFDIRDVMDKGKILLVNLSKGKTGELNGSLLGLIIVSKIQMAAMARARVPESDRRDFFLYIDEFQNFVTDSIATILSEARKYHLNLCMAHQYISQLSRGEDTKVRDAVFGNVGSMISFKIGATDAEYMEKEFEPIFDRNDLINIEKYHAYARVMFFGHSSEPFSMKMFNFDDVFTQDKEIGAAIRNLSRMKFGKDARLVEQEIFARDRE